MIQIDYLMQKTKPSDGQQKVRTCWIADYDFPANHKKTKKYTSS